MHLALCKIEFGSTGRFVLRIKGLLLLKQSRPKNAITRPQKLDPCPHFLLSRPHQIRFVNPRPATALYFNRRKMRGSICPPVWCE